MDAFFVLKMQFKLQDLQFLFVPRTLCRMQPKQFLRLRNNLKTSIPQNKYCFRSHEEREDFCCVPCLLDQVP